MLDLASRKITVSSMLSSNAADGFSDAIAIQRSFDCPIGTRMIIPSPVRSNPSVSLQRHLGMRSFRESPPVNVLHGLTCAKKPAGQDLRRIFFCLYCKIVESTAADGIETCRRSVQRMDAQMQWRGLDAGIVDVTQPAGCRAHLRQISTDCSGCRPCCVPVPIVPDSQCKSPRS